MQNTILDNPTLQTAFWGSAAICAAVTCPVAFSVSLATSVLFSGMNTIVKKQTKKSLFEHGHDLLMKPVVWFKLDKKFENVISKVYGTAILSTVATCSEQRRKKAFDVCVPVAYGLATAIFSWTCTGVLSGLKTGALLYREIVLLVPASKPSRPSVPPASK